MNDVFMLTLQIYISMQLCGDKKEVCRATATESRGQDKPKLQRNKASPFLDHDQA